MRPSSSHTKSVQLPLPTSDHCADRGRSFAASTCVRNARAVEDWRREYTCECRGLILPLPFPGPSPLIGTYRIYNKSASTRLICSPKGDRRLDRLLHCRRVLRCSPYPHSTLIRRRRTNWQFQFRSRTDEWQSFLNGHRLINSAPPALRFLHSRRRKARFVRLGNE